MIRGTIAGVSALVAVLAPGAGAAPGAAAVPEWRAADSEPSREFKPVYRRSST